MKIAVDLDDVLSHLASEMDRYYNDTYGTNLKLEDHTDFDLSKIWNCSHEEMVKINQDFFESDHIKNLVPMENAVEVVNRLADKNELTLITSRPRNLEKISREWLDKYFPDKFSKYLFTSQFSELNAEKTKADWCVEMGIKIIIEDCLKYAYQCAEKEITVLLFDRPWNRKEENLPKNIVRVNSWNEIEKILNSRDKKHIVKNQILEIREVGAKK